MEYFSRLLGTRGGRAGPTSTTAAAPPSGTAVTAARSGFLRAVAGIGDSESSAAASSARKRADGTRSGRASSGKGAAGSARARGGKKGALGSDDLAAGFIEDWEAVKATLTSPDQRALHYGIVRSDVPLLLERMIDALIVESTAFTTPADGLQESTTDIPPCMEYLLRSSLLDILVQLCLPNKPKGALAQAIQFFTQLIVALDESFVSRQAVHRPLARLIRGCVGDEDGDDLERLRSLGLDIGDEDDLLAGGGGDEDDDSSREGGEGSDDDADGGARRRRRRTRSRYGRINSHEAASFEHDLVDLMAHIATRIKSAPELLLIFFHDRRKSSHHASSAASPSLSSAGSTTSSQLTFLGPDAKPEFPLFSYLLRFIHREGSIGELARAGLLNLIHVALAPEAMAIPFSDAADSAGPSSRRNRTASSSSFATNSGASASVRQALAAFILDSDFAEVLGAGLGAVYGLLPTKLVLLRSHAADSSGAAGDDSVGSGTAAEGTEPGAGGVASMLGSEGMRLGASSSAPLPSTDSELVDAHFLLDDGAAASAAAELPERLRLAGMATSNDPEVQTQVRLLVLLLDFVQDVLGTSAEAIYRDAIFTQDSDEPATPTQAAYSIAASLSSSIVDAIRSIFLQNVVYPSMLECSDADGSATAVMSYLDVILSVVDDRSILADVVIGYLVGIEPEVEADGQRAWHGGAPSESTVRGGEEDADTEPNDSVIRLDGSGTGRSSNRSGKKLKRRRSLALRMVEEDSRAASNNRWGGVVDGDGELAFAYNASDDAFGRYTLKDLILAHLEESASIGEGKRKKRRVSAQARQASFRLLRTLLAEHGRFAMGTLISCVRDESATAFPYPQPSALAPPESSTDVNVANGTANGSALAPHSIDEPQAWPDEAPTSLRRLDDDLTSRLGSLDDESQVWGGGAGAASSGAPHMNGGFAQSANSTGKAAPSSGSGTQLAAVSLESHLHELALYSYLVGSLRAIDEPKSGARSLSGIQASSYERYLQDATDLLACESTYLYGLEAGRDDPLPLAPFAHRLTPRTDSTLRTLVHALARFFMHSPESNLLLTGTLAALARCPYRSLEGWMSPRAARRSVGDAGQEGDGDGDQGLEAQIRAVGSYLSWSPAWITGLTPTRSGLAEEIPDADCPIVLFVLLGLANQVRRYARSIPEFGTYLRERREGLMFVENLNDALGLGGIGVEDEDGTLGFGDVSDSANSTPTAATSQAARGSGSSSGTAVVPPSKVPTALSSTLRGEGREDSAGLPAVLFYKTAPPEDAGRPGTTTLPSSAASATKARAGSNRGSKSGNRRGTSTPGSGTDSPNPSGNGIMVQPFARHYAETGAIFVGTAAVRLPAQWRASGDDDAAEDGERRRIRFEDDEGGERASADESADDTESDLDRADGEGTNSLQPGSAFLSRPTAVRMGSSTSSLSSTGGRTKGVLKKRRSETQHVTLSALLDNVVILEQAVMELLAIVQVRRCAGIDAIAVGSQAGA